MKISGFSEDYEFAGTKTPIADLHEEVLSYVQTIEKALMRTSYILAENRKTRGLRRGVVNQLFKFPASLP